MNQNDPAFYGTLRHQAAIVPTIIHAKPRTLSSSPRQACCVNKQTLPFAQAWAAGKRSATTRLNKADSSALEPPSTRLPPPEADDSQSIRISRSNPCTQRWVSKIALEYLHPPSALRVSPTEHGDLNRVITPGGAAPQGEEMVIEKWDEGCCWHAGGAKAHLPWCNASRSPRTAARPEKEPPRRAATET